MKNDTKRQWYTVQTYAGYENKVKANLEQRIASMGMDTKIFNVLIPVEEKVLVKDGKTKQVSRKLFPSYVFVEMIMDDQSWYVVRHTPGVTGFVGAGNHPIPIADVEMRSILAKLGDSSSKPMIEIDLAIGDVVKVSSGAFEGSFGPVSEILHDKGKVRFTMTVFGRETEVEVDYTELEKL